MHKLIPIINKIQEILSQHKISESVPLPQIIVVGAQSSGKSSVLESIVGHDFLPRGAGIVTRRPLLMHLHQSDKEYGEFVHSKKIFTSYADIKKEIEIETIRIAGKNKDVNKQAIILNLYSPKYLELSLIDLPGLTKVPIGNQANDIELQIKSMVKEFISQKSSIILAVTAANTDLATSDSLQIAHEADPEHVRTIGVLTKLDIMDECTDAIDILTGKLHYLKLGYVGVVCRSQNDINKELLLNEHLANESKFFENSLYKDHLDKCGTHVLTKKLNMVLMDQIRLCLPNLKLHIQKLLTDNQAILESIGSPLTDGEIPKTLLEIIGKYCKCYAEILVGSFFSENHVELKGGARIKYIFTNIFTNTLLNGADLNDFNNEDMNICLSNAQGLNPTIFLSENSYKAIICSLLNKVEPLAVDCVNLIYNELKSILNYINLVEFQRFRKLNIKIVEKMKELLDRLKGPAKSMMIDLISIERSYINIEHPDFKLTIDKCKQNFASFESKKEEAKKEQKKEPNNWFWKREKKADNQMPNEKRFNPKEPSLEALPEIIKPNKASDREITDITIAKDAVMGYFNIVKKNLMDYVPKAIMKFLVNKSIDMAQNYLLEQLYQSKNDIKELMEEDSSASNKRLSLSNLIQALKESMEIINQLKDGEIPE